MIESASLDRCAEYVCIHALIIAKLELIDVEMEILFADLVECPDDPALHDGPKTLDGIGMNCSAYIFSLSVMHHAVRDGFVERAIALMIVRGKQADSVRYSFVDEAVKRGRVCALNYASHDISLPLHGSDHNELARSTCSSEVSASALSLVLVLGLPADICFIDFDIANEFLKFDIAQRHADFIAHEPRGFVGAESHVATDLKRANALLAGKHQMNDAEPDAEWFVSILEDRSDKDREAIAHATRRALVALPVIILRMWMDIFIGAARTAHAFRPAVLHQIFRAGRIIWKQALKVANRHLVNVHGAFGFPHGLGSFQSGASMPC